jgi:biopolymer transport protein ExbB/TolQ
MFVKFLLSLVKNISPTIILLFLSIILNFGLLNNRSELIEKINFLNTTIAKNEVTFLQKEKVLLKNIESKKNEISKLNAINNEKDNTIKNLYETNLILEKNKNDLKSDIEKIKYKKLLTIDCNKSTTINNYYLDKEQLDILNKINTSVLQYKNNN